jgi:hypothetical protein
MFVFRQVCGRIAAIAASVLVLSVAFPSVALAQGFYFKQIDRDGRIYVFNNAAEAARFEKTGEMGTGLTHRPKSKRIASMPGAPSAWIVSSRFQRSRQATPPWWR